MAKLFAALARQARLDNRIRLHEVAEALGVSVAYVSEVERGNRPAPSPERAVKWAEAVKGDPHTFADAAMADKTRVDLPLEDSDPPEVRELALALHRVWRDLNVGEREHIRETIHRHEERKRRHVS